MFTLEELSAERDGVCRESVAVVFPSEGMVQVLHTSESTGIQCSIWSSIYGNKMGGQESRIASDQSIGKGTWSSAFDG